ncbi:pyridoxamine 5'-phosphate oxidase family protein [Hyphococcus sp.]|uniref:pyridoxamine 5'-phosphate oxidase family protein n=1 Tax=Hyphococcus sp. TaxID=2038636 RepID=UPI003CCB847B
MTDLKKARKNPEQLFWDEVDDVNAGMLGVEGSGQHMQPMSPYCDREGGAIWFFTEKDSDLIDAIGTTGGSAMFTIVSKSRHFHACARGALIENLDRGKVEEYWNPVAAAWYKDGKDDPNLTLLQLKLEDASLWASSGNPIAFAWRIVKGNLSDAAPEDMGVRNHFRFAA